MARVLIRRDNTGVLSQISDRATEVRMRNTSQPERIQVAVYACTQIARSRANDAQNRLNRLICPRWFDSSRLSAMTIVPIRAVDYARRNRLPFAYENPLCSGQVRRDHARIVGEKILHCGPRVRFVSIGIPDLRDRNTCTNVGRPVYGYTGTWFAARVPPPWIRIENLT